MRKLVRRMEPTGLLGVHRLLILHMDDKTDVLMRGLLYQECLFWRAFSGSSSEKYSSSQWTFGGDPFGFVFQASPADQLRMHQRMAPQRPKAKRTERSNHARRCRIAAR